MSRDTARVVGFVIGGLIAGLFILLIHIARRVAGGLKTRVPRESDVRDQAEDLGRKRRPPVRDRHPRCPSGGAIRVNRRSREASQHFSATSLRASALRWLDRA